MKRIILTLSLFLFTMNSASQGQDQATETKPTETAASQATAETADQEPANAEDKSDVDSTKETSKEDAVEVPATLQFKMNSIEGEEVDLAQYAGKVVVIVNTASRCGMTPQYKDLQELHEKYGEQGLVILGFPCNQFGGQEPDSEEDIQSFCEKNYGVEFDLFAKVDVKGEKACDLFKFLTAQDVQPAGAGEVRWNFEKFILDKSGKLIARYGSRVKPGSEEFVKLLEEEMSK